MKEIEKPYIILSSAMTIDGKIASKSGDPDISDEDDWKEVHKLRTEVDGIMVGKGTILKDNPKLHIKFYEHHGYRRIVVDSNLNIPIDSNVISFQPKTYPTIICTTENIPVDKMKRFEEKNVKILQAGNGARVDLIKLLPLLKKIGLSSILLEGGGTLNWSFIEKDLIDEIYLSVAPWIIGGKDATSLTEGIGFNKMNEAPRFELIEVRSRNNYVILRYKRIMR
ncbi:MAG: 2,5-diamino-6-(ribosylamino)-4(3H)-pyrimidinone 5'-phosphate reductase [Promethearchaeota archaeon]